MMCRWWLLGPSFLLVWAATIQSAAAEPTWQATEVAQDRKDVPSHYNSQRLVLDRRGWPRIVYVKQPTATTDQLVYARQSGTGWRHETVYTMAHSGQAYAGINGYALALDRRDQPHVFLYCSNYQKPRTFEERWVFRDRQAWQMRIVRSDHRGGAALHDPHLAIDRRGYMHVTAYAHAGYPSSHRARHRFFDGLAFRIEPLPRPAGKSDSNPSNLFVDGRDVIHVVYDSKKALRLGDAEPGYPDSSLVYITRSRGAWSTPQLIRRRVGPDPKDTGYFVLSVGITGDRRGGLHVTYAVSKRGRSDPTYIRYAHGAGGRWTEQDVVTVPAAQSGTFRVAVSSPAIDPTGNPHFAFDSAQGTTYVHREGKQWKSSQVPGDLEGFARDARGRIHLLTSSGPILTYYRTD